MKQLKSLRILCTVIGVLILSACSQGDKKNNGDALTNLDPLPSWNQGDVKQAIVDFVTKTTTETSPDFIPVTDRIAVFDNDGTLWSEQPLYFQFAFAIDQIKKMAPEHPEWQTEQPFKAILAGDLSTALTGGEHAIVEIVMATHAGMTTDEFSALVKGWISTAKHPQTGKLYKDMVFLPMIELLNYLRSNQYKTFIVSGGGIDFIRAWAEETYGIPSDQVVGSSGKVKYEVIDGKPVLIKLPELSFIDDKEGKPVGIHQYIGKRPVFAAGNSDGDYAMLQWTCTGDGPRFGMFVHHTDSVREFAYDRESSIGGLNKGLDDAAQYNWLIVDMEKDWGKIYAD
ncbi:HAD family hydrolase [Mangrovibacterium lignilyticum]|uniref:HAD family hydrolase n=1 Tax=Mangrovibacterium lignilyticum TaxID=2668052 RepID=UPI001967C610|nr:HAD family hydrolase [Mangrovibacterium lignilyticum]